MKKKIFLLCIILMSAEAPAQKTREFWISPASVRPDFWTLFQPSSKWDTLKGIIHVLSMHVNALDTRDTFLIGEAVRSVNRAGLKINFEVGGLRPFSGCDSLAGERHAQLELSKLRKWIEPGGRIDYISMDSPVNTMIRNGNAGNCGWSVHQAAEELIDYMQAVHAVLPSVEFGWIEPVPWYSVGPYPNHPGNNYGDLPSVMDTVMTIVHAGQENITLFHADSPYGYSDNPQTLGWNKLVYLERHVRTLGMRFGMIFNSQAGGFTSDKLFHDETLDGWWKYCAAGGDPDIAGVWSWYDHPSMDYPESEPYTFTHTCKKFFEQLIRSDTSSTAARLDPGDGRVFHGVGQARTGVDEYVAAMGDSTIMPAVYNFYYDIPGTRGDRFPELRQMLEYEKSIGRVPHLSIAMTNGAIWTDSLIATGTQYDYVIDSIAHIVRDFGRKIFIRPGFEFNGSWFPYHPYLYPIAFRKIVDRIRAAAEPDSIAFLWCYYGAGGNDFDSVDARGARWYPGDDHVDWFSLDLFGAADFHPDSADVKRGRLTNKGKGMRFLSMARVKRKPVFLSEVSAAFTYLTRDSIDGIHDWNAWFDPFFRFLDAHPDIKGFNYTNWDWSRYGQWKEWGDARIEVNPYILSRYRTEMRNGKYIHLRLSLTGLREDIRHVPREQDMARNFPNPFSSTTTLELPALLSSNESGAEHPSKRSGGILKIYDILGREVLDLSDRIADRASARPLHVPVHGSRLPGPGIYFYRYSKGGGIRTGEFVYVR